MTLTWKRIVKVISGIKVLEAEWEDSVFITSSGEMSMVYLRDDQHTADEFGNDSVLYV